MDATLNLQDLAQWLAFIALFGTLWVRVKARDKDRDEITQWRTNIERDIEAIDARLDRHEVHDNRLFDRLDAIANELKGVSERLVRIESRMNGG